MSLHASAKLYGCRVDAIQQETVRLMCGFGRQRKRGEPDEAHAEVLPLILPLDYLITYT